MSSNVDVCRNSLDLFNVTVSLSRASRMSEVQVDDQILSSKQSKVKSQWMWKSRSKTSSNSSSPFGKYCMVGPILCLYILLLYGVKAKSIRSM